MSKNCCSRALGTCPGDSPFDRILVVEWYDGPTSGVAVCADCGAEYTFRMAAWDDAHEQRVYALSRLPNGSLTQLVDACKGAGMPRWPVWWPAIFASDQARSEAWSAANRILESSGDTQFVIASRDLTHTIDACRRLRNSSESESARSLQEREAAFVEWMTFLRVT